MHASVKAEQTGWLLPYDH